MAGTYTTVQGDTWDIIAYKVYEDTSYTSLLMANNLKLIDNFVFSAGVTVSIPDKPEETDDFPEWRS